MGVGGEQEGLQGAPQSLPPGGGRQGHPPPASGSRCCCVLRGW